MSPTPTYATILGRAARAIVLHVLLGSGVTEANDDGSRTLFKSMIQDEERHVDCLEAQIHAIKEMGIGNYLARQMNGEK